MLEPEGVTVGADRIFIERAEELLGREAVTGDRLKLHRPKLHRAAGGPHHRICFAGTPASSMTTAPAKRFSTATSVLLDVLRLACAIMIASVHLTQPYFSIGWPNLTDYGKPALVMFFLLSGLVIRYVTAMRRGKTKDFWVDRISRIYSVVVPALGFTIVASYLAMRINPGLLHAATGAPTPAIRSCAQRRISSSWHSRGTSRWPLFRTSRSGRCLTRSSITPSMPPVFYLAGTRALFWLVIIAAYGRATHPAAVAAVADRLFGA